jgi:hypothetical protein
MKVEWAHDRDRRDDRRTEVVIAVPRSRRAASRVGTAQTAIKMNRNQRTNRALNQSGSAAISTNILRLRCRAQQQKPDHSVCWRRPRDPRHECKMQEAIPASSTISRTRNRLHADAAMLSRKPSGGAMECCVAAFIARPRCRLKSCKSPAVNSIITCK